MKTQPQYAGFWTRFTAHTLDCIILGVPFALFIMPLIGALAFDAEALKQQMQSNNPATYFALYSAMIKSAILCLLAWSAILAYLTASKWQATIGKKIMGVYVCSADGEKPKFLQSFLRYISLPLLILTIQTPERFYIYENLEQLAQKTAPSPQDLEASFMTPISSFIGLACFIVVFMWYGSIAFRKQKTAGHDILFNTRVIHGKP